MTKNKGFSLLEVVVAFAVAALCLGAAAQVFSAATRHVGLVQDRMRALSLAETVLAAAGVTEALAPGVVSGELSGGLQWRRTVERYPQADDAKGAEDEGTEPHWVAYRVTVEVRRGAQPVLSIGSVRLGRTA